MLAVANFLRVVLPGFVTSEEVWLSGSVIVTLPLGVLGAAFLLWKHREWFDKWVPVGFRDKPETRTEPAPLNLEPAESQQPA
ncbi:hypothetical protein AOZ06_10290 [Kibdelosporangium phytohabitans]|uniref:Uncharacterized protein n=1 Tax=Kibdelosporangium phytohabitans TaxID=860235 RepID=A0A0N9HW32_9PSEU|nr:hypothetical protein AOZ06_10290 [Kibdelosporangium phytohabitans]